MIDLKFTQEYYDSVVAGIENAFGEKWQPDIRIADGNLMVSVGSKTCFLSVREPYNDQLDLKTELFMMGQRLGFVMKKRDFK